MQYPVQYTQGNSKRDYNTYRSTSVVLKQRFPSQGVRNAFRSILGEAAVPAGLLKASVQYPQDHSKQMWNAQYSYLQAPSRRVCNNTWAAIHEQVQSRRVCST